MGNYTTYRNSQTSTGVSDSLDFYPATFLTKHRVFVEAVGTATAGTLSVKVSDHGFGLQTLSGVTIDLTSPNPVLIEGPVERIQVSPTGITGATQYKVGITSWMDR